MKHGPKDFSALLKADEAHEQATAEVRDSYLDYRSVYRLDNIEVIYSLAIVPYISAIEPNAKFGLNKDILNKLVYSYFLDIDRFKKFHESHLLNAPKKAGFLIKWIIKHKPIYYDDDSVDDDDLRGFLAIVNEYFALCVGFAYAEISHEDVDSELVDRLLYDFLYRVPDEHAITLWFETYYVLTGRPLYGDEGNQDSD